MSGTRLERDEERWSFLNDEITITSALTKDTYVFKKPTMYQHAAVGSRAASIRRSQAADGLGNIYSLDKVTADSIFGFACFEVLLIRSSAEWPFSRDDKGLPVVDSTKFPLEKSDELMEVVIKLDDALTAFRAGWTPDRPRTAEQAVDSGQNPGAQQPVSS